MSVFTAERLRLLKHLKHEFDIAYGEVDVDAGRADARYIAAEDAYKAWRKAIDPEALLLIEEVQRLQADNDRLREELAGRASTVSPKVVKEALSAAEIARQFDELEDLATVKQKIDGT